jgi:hypothetical protein
MNENQLQSLAEDELIELIIQGHRRTMELREQTIKRAIDGVQKTNESAGQTGIYLETIKKSVSQFRWKEITQGLLALEIESAPPFNQQLITAYISASKQPKATEPKQLIKQLSLMLSGPNENDKPRTERHQRTTETSWIEAFNRVSYVFQDVIDKRPVTEWSGIERDTYLLRAKPIVEAYVKLGGSL